MVALNIFLSMSALVCFAIAADWAKTVTMPFGYPLGMALIAAASCVGVIIGALPH